LRTKPLAEPQERAKEGQVNSYS